MCLLIICFLYLNVAQGNKEDWRGSLSVEADTILHQHAIQGDITPVQKAFCYWIAYSQKFRDSSFDSTCLLNILKNLNEHWNGGVLSGEEVIFTL